MTKLSPRDDSRIFVTGNLIADGKLSIGDGYRAKNSELAATGLPFARAGNIDGGFHFEDADHFPETDLANVGEKISQTGDVVFTSKGTVGRLAFVRENTPRFVYAPQLCYWRSLDREVIDPLWMYYWMHSGEFRDQMLGVKGQTDMADYVSLSDQRRMHITLSPIEEQRDIAGVLGALDDKIEQNRRTSGALERLARAIFRAWFVDFEPIKAKAAGAIRFPSMPQEVFNSLPNHLVDSELGLIPQAWLTKPLYETAQFINGAAFREEHCCEHGDGLPVIKIAELKDGITGQTKSSNRKDLNARYQIDNGEILYSWSGSPDTSLDTFLWTKGPGLLNQHIFRVLTETNAQRYFVYYLLKHLRQPLIEIARDKQTTGLGHVTVADMRQLLVCWPPKRMFEGFERQAGPIFERSFALAMESEKLAGLRNYLLPKLLSGKVRVRTSTDIPVVIGPITPNLKAPSSREANPEFKEAILIAALVRALASPLFPLGRKRYNKFAYFVHRKAEHDVRLQFLKKAAGPYSPWSRYQGPEKIALGNNYIERCRVEKRTGWVVGKKIADIDRYLPRYGFEDALNWAITKFRKTRNDDLELLSTVDFASIDLMQRKLSVSVRSIRDLIASEPEWAPKLNRAIFSDANIAKALAELKQLFSEDAGKP